MIKNTERIPSLSGTAKYRIPDFMNNSKIIESKNVQYQRATNQIKDTAQYAQKVGKSYTIVTHQYTRISNQLREISKQLNIIIKSLGKKKP